MRTRSTYLIFTFLLALISINVQAQNVGIGTPTPDYKLDVNGDIGLNDTLHHNDDSDTYLLFSDDELRIVVGGNEAFFADADSVVFNNGDGAYKFGSDIIIAGDTIPYLFFADESLNRVGIGTSTPEHLLDVNGDSRFIGDLLGTVFTIEQDNGGRLGIGTSTPEHTLDVNGDSRFIGDLLGTVFTIEQDNGGRLGIGTDSPEHTLDVNGDSRFIGDLLGTVFTIEQDNGGRLGIGTDSPEHTLDVDGDSRFIGDLLGTVFTVEQDNGGRFGIGTDSPEHTLDVNGDSRFIGDLLGTVFTVEQDNGGRFGIGTDSPEHTLDVNGDSRFIGDLLGTVFTVEQDNGGRFGIGTDSPEHTLDVNGDSRFIGDLLGTVFTVEQDNGGRFGIGTDSPEHTLDVNGDSRFIGDLLGTVFTVEQDNGGRFGIGTDSPEHTLDVNGDSRFIGDLLGTVFTVEQDNGGRLGIGTDSPEHTLDVNGDSRFIGDLLGTVFTVEQDNGGRLGIGTDSPEHTLDVNGDSRFIGDLLGTVFVMDQEEGRMGLGTTEPAYTLDVVGTSRIDGSLIVEDSGSGFMTNEETPLLDVLGHLKAESFEVTGVTEFASTTMDTLNVNTSVNAALIETAVLNVGNEITDPENAGATIAPFSVNSDGWLGIGKTFSDVPFGVKGNSRLEGTTKMIGTLVIAGDENATSETAIVNVQGMLKTADLVVTGTTDFGDIDMDLITADEAVISTSLKVGTGINAGSSASTFNVTSNGWLGIGTIDPSTELHVNGSSTLNGIVEISHSTGPNDNVVLLDVNGILETEDLRVTSFAKVELLNAETIKVTSFIAGENENVAITLGGNVGIGTSDPQHDLHVIGNSKLTGDVIFDGDVDQSSGDYTFSNNSGNFTVTATETMFKYGEGNDKLKINNYGVSIGAGNPISGVDLNVHGKIKTQDLEITGTMDMTSLSAGQYGDVVITAGGNVGIGTTDPGDYKLYVSGNSKFSGNTTYYGNVEHLSGNYSFNNSSSSFTVKSNDVMFKYGTGDKKMTINENGVNIGTGSPMSGVDFNVEGKIKTQDLEVTGNLMVDNMVLDSIAMNSIRIGPGGSNLQKMQAGVYDIPNSPLFDGEVEDGGNGHAVKVFFHNAFTSVPVVQGTYFQEDSYDNDNMISFTLKEVTTTYAVFNVRLISTYESYGDNYLDDDFQDYVPGKIHWTATLVQYPQSNGAVL